MIGKVRDSMPEKEVWTVHGRKKVYLVDDDNCIVEELEDRGPLSEMEFNWVKSSCGKSYKQWVKEMESQTE